MRRFHLLLSALALALSGCGAQPAAPPAGPVTVVPPADGQGVADLVERVGDAVVNIDTLSGPDPTVTDGQAAPPSEPARRGVGSGFLVRPDGLVVTNDHVVRGASQVLVTLADGRRFPGRVIGLDPITDLALVDIDGSGLPTLPFADPAGIRAGQYAVAMGSPLGLQQTVTWGIVSAVDRTIDLSARTTYLQTDAPINPGNSGGPLLNLAGEVVGVTTAIADEAQGIGFAIPVETLVDVLPELEATGSVAHAWIGIGVGTSPEGGALVRSVAEGGPAAAVGLQPGDRIVAIDGRALLGATDLIRAIANRDVGEAVRLEVVRQGQPLAIDLTLGRMPPP